MRRSIGRDPPSWWCMAAAVLPSLLGGSLPIDLLILFVVIILFQQIFIDLILNVFILIFTTFVQNVLRVAFIKVLLFCRGTLLVKSWWQVGWIQWSVVILQFSPGPKVTHIVDAAASVAVNANVSSTIGSRNLRLQLARHASSEPSDLNELVSESLAAGHSHLGFASSFELENYGVTVFNLYNFQDFSKPLESVNNGLLVVCFKACNLEFGRTSVNAGSKGSG